MNKQWLKNTQSVINRSSLRLLPLSIAFAIQGISSTTEASPWLEANDPFLRSDLLALSDSGTLDSPVNHYPFRWSMIGDEVDIARATSSDDLNRVANHVSHVLSSAKYGRGNRVAKMVYGSDMPDSAGFGQFSKDEWGAFASYETLESGFAFRVTSGYSNYNGDKDFVWNDSYLSLNADSWLFSVGSIDRWWGQGWQHNLILGSYARSNPDFSASYIGQNSLLGNWSFEAIMGFPDDAAKDHHSAVRLVAKPASIFEFGLTYQSWFDGSGFVGSEKQTALDAKLTLPSVSHFYHSVYGEVASTSKTSQAGAWLLGWTGQFDIAKQTVRIVLEKQDSTSDRDSQDWDGNSYLSYSEGVAKTTYELDNSISAAVYLQLENDHNLSLIAQKSEQNNNTAKSIQANYRLPALEGMLHFGAGKTDNESTKDETNIWTGYEFRF